MGGRPRSRRRNDPEGNRGSEGQAGEGPEIASFGRRLQGAGSAWGRFILVVDETDSTNVLAASLARRGAPHGTVVLAKSQSAGKGRWGRRWESAEGGLYLSLLIRPETGEEPSEPSEKDIRNIGVLPLTASVAAAEALEQSAAIASELRWPNDLYFAGRKLGGILCESSFAGQRCEFAVVGIGVNVNQAAEDFPGEVSARATSLRAILGRAVDPLEVALAVTVALEKWWERESRPRILQRWRELASGLEGARVRVVPRVGSGYAASIAGLADDGGLEVRLDDGTTRTLRSDDVHLQEDSERSVRLRAKRFGGAAPEPDPPSREPLRRGPAVARRAEAEGRRREPAVDEDYYEEVESYFVARRGSPLFITPSEWDLVLRWEQLGIPLAVVKEGIDRVFERPKTLLKPRRLGYCRQTVEAAFRRFRESSLGGRGAGTPQEDAGAEAHLREVSTRLQELAAALPEKERGLAPFLERAADAVRSLSERAGEAPGEAERELTALDEELVAGSEAVLGDTEQDELRREAESSLDSYRERMPEKIYRAALESAYRRRLRKRIGLPTLSLYSR